jgi:hypothetical protein
VYGFDKVIKKDTTSLDDEIWRSRAGRLIVEVDDTTVVKTVRELNIVVGVEDTTVKAVRAEKLGASLPSLFIKNSREHRS